MGNGEETRFWEDGGKDRFARLYYLEKEKSVIIKNRGVCCDGVWQCVWDWFREPRGRANGDMEALCNLLQNYLPLHSCRDKWSWKLSEDGEFLVKKITAAIEENTLMREECVQGTRFNKLIPKKIGIFV